MSGWLSWPLLLSIYGPWFWMVSYKTRINSFFFFASPATIDYLLVIVSFLVDNDSLQASSTERLEQSRYVLSHPMSLYINVYWIHAVLSRNPISEMGDSVSKLKNHWRCSYCSLMKSFYNNYIWHMDH